MKTVSMSGSLRESVGKKDAKKLRAEGKVPCVLYGGDKQHHFSIEELEFKKLIFTPDTYFLKMELGGKEYNCILKDVQYHPVSDSVLHADFQEFIPGKPVTTSVPIRLEGDAPGLMKGGVLVKKFRKLPVRALPENMPEEIVIDISSLEINDYIHVSDIDQEKFTVEESPQRFVVGVMTTRLAAVTTPGEEEEEEGEGEEGEEGEGEGEEGAAGEGGEGKAPAEGGEKKEE